MYILSISALCRIIPFQCQYVADMKSTKVENTEQPFSARFHPLETLENGIIPHIMRICTAKDRNPEDLWAVLDSLIELWKKIVILAHNSKSKNTDARRLNMSLLKSFHVILRVLPSNEKIELASKRFLSQLDCSNDSMVRNWIPKIIELYTPFLKDDNKYQSLTQGCKKDNIRLLDKLCNDLVKCNGSSSDHRSASRRKLAFGKSSPKVF
jgi:hypothetical protein